MTDSPDWTEFNDSDPGITLLHLFAFLCIGVVVGFGVWLFSTWGRRRKRRRPTD